MLNVGATPTLNPSPQGGGKYLRWLVPVHLAFILVGCSGPTLPFSKEKPEVVANESVIAPPWEAYVEAGPGAENDLDLETLNGPTAISPPPPPTAQVETPEVVAEIAPVSPVPKKPKAGQVDINSVAILAVTGGKGAELTNAMRKAIAGAGWPVVQSKSKNALTIRGSLKIADPIGDVQKVSLVWLVETPDGKSLGDIKQTNDVPAGSLDAGWGQNADYAAQAAAEGIFKLIQKYR